MSGKEFKTFKQFMLTLDRNTRIVVFQQIVKKCHVTDTSVRLWERGETSPQQWRISVINNIAKRYGYEIVFSPSKRRQHLDNSGDVGAPARGKTNNDNNENNQQGGTL